MVTREATERTDLKSCSVPAQNQRRNTTLDVLSHPHSPRVFHNQRPNMTHNTQLTMSRTTRLRPIPEFADTTDTDTLDLHQYRYRVLIPIPVVTSQPPQQVVLRYYA